MGCRDLDQRPRSPDPVNLFHRLDEIVQMLEDLATHEAIEGVISKRPRPAVEIVNHVGTSRRVDVYGNRARHGPNPPGPEVD